MSDILLHYLLMARRRADAAESWLAGGDRLLATGIEQLVMTAIARVAVTSQHERVTRRKNERPASHLESVQFHDVSEPDRPAPPHFEERTQEIPLRATIEVFTCTRCHGSQKTRCWRCQGRELRCSSCAGSGRASSSACQVCDGSGFLECSGCQGSGWRDCGWCLGEGRLASWEADVYQWQIKRFVEEVYPLDDPRLQRAYRRWREISSPDRVPDLEPATMVEHLGYETPETLEIAARAEAAHRRLADEARGSDDRHLFHQTEYSVTPAGYVLVRPGRRAHYYWRVGRGKKAQEVEPRRLLDLRRASGWLGIAAGLTGSMATFLPAAGLLAGLVTGSAVPAAAETLVVAAAGGSGLLTFWGARRAFRRPSPVATIGLLPASGKPTAWLACLAHLGSYTERLKVLDRLYDLQLGRLLGERWPERQSETLSLELEDGRQVRLVEVETPSRLSETELSRALRALDAVVLIGDGDPSADELEKRLRILGRPPAARFVVDRIGNAASRDGKSRNT